MIGRVRHLWMGEKPKKRLLVAAMPLVLAMNYGAGSIYIYIHIIYIYIYILYIYILYIYIYIYIYIYLYSSSKAISRGQPYIWSALHFSLPDVAWLHMFVVLRFLQCFDPYLFHSFLLGGLEHGFYFSIYILGIIIPSDFHIFQRGRYTTNQYHIPFYLFWLCKQQNQNTTTTSIGIYVRICKEQKKSFSQNWYYNHYYCGIHNII